MGTRLILDNPSVEMTEPPYDFHREASAIKRATSGKNLFHKWQTGSWTLCPVNFWPNFQETNYYEVLKERLVDCTYQADWWTEVPHNVSKDYGPCDYFFRTIVPSTSVPVDGSKLLNALIDVTTNVVSDIQGQMASPVGAILSKRTFPENQGYMLRFQIDGKIPYRRTEILGFQFADYALELNSDGTAQLFRTFDRTTYGYVYGFNWANPGTSRQAHGFMNELAIVPHGRRYIEFVVNTFGMNAQDPFNVQHPWVIMNRALYTKPDDAVFDSNGQPIVTEPGQWFLCIHREFKVTVQVSRIGYYNGPAEFYDDAVDPGFGCLYPMNLQLFGDYNYGTVGQSLIDPVTKNPYVSDGNRRAFQLKTVWTGQGDLDTVSGPDSLMSTLTPELYGYSVSKYANYRSDGRVPYQTHVDGVNIDNGSSPESERLSVKIDSHFGEVDYWSERPDIPIALIDSNTGVVFFEGRSHRAELTDAPGTAARMMTLEAHGMVDSLLRCTWTWSRPNFGLDPEDPQGRAWFWQAAVRRCFAAAGFNPWTQVYFEPVDGTDASMYDFRLWMDGNSGGPGGDKIGTGPAVGGRWYPAQHAPVHEFLDYLLRRVMGWDWYWNRYYGRWQIHKRPTVAALANQPVLATFGKNQATQSELAALYPTAPAYTHRQMKKETTRAEYTTVIVWGLMDTQGLLSGVSRDELKKLMQDAKVNVQTEYDPIITNTRRFVPMVFENPNGFSSPAHPNPITASPDWVGTQRVKMVPLLNFPSKEALLWAGRRIYEDLCFGHYWRNFVADWGDPYTAYLRKWDRVVIDGVDYTIDRIEPEWSGGGSDVVRRARYRCWRVRTDRPPPF